MSKGCDILNLEWNSSKSRDREVATLVCNYLRENGKTVVEGPMFGGYKLINEHKPKVLYISNSVGAKLNLDVVKYAKSKGIHCITGMAEGNFNEAGINQFVWGVNRAQILYEDTCFLWNSRSKDLALKYFPSLASKIGVCGAIGFDRYKIVQNETPKWLAEKTAEYKQVVGVGCWNFDFTIKGSHCYQVFNGNHVDTNDLEFFQRERDKFNREILNLIQDNPERLFIIKQHPGSLNGDFSSGVSGCRELSNAVVYKNDISITEAISLSDIWITYESTTAVEAWLLGKPTGLLNPSGVDFPFREGFHYGQPNYTKAAQWSEVLKNLEVSGHLKGFDELANKRSVYIKDMIEWDDGLNHVRMGNAILDALENIAFNTATAVPLGLMDQYRALKRGLVWTLRGALNLLPEGMFKKRRQLLKWDEKMVGDNASLRLQQQMVYYAKCGYSLNQLREIKAINPILTSNSIEKNS